MCFKKDLPYVRNRKFLVFEAGHSLCSNHEKSTCHFLVNSADRPRICANPISDSRKSRDDRPNSPKSGVSIFQTSNGLKIARIAPIWTIFGRNRSRRPNLNFRKFSYPQKISRVESEESDERRIRPMTNQTNDEPDRRRTRRPLCPFCFYTKAIAA